jgi:hypothetical protein
VLWSDGQPFTSADVRYTWQSFRDSRIWAPGFDLIEAIETPDPWTAIVHYRQFYPNYLIQFGGNGTGVFPAHQCGPTHLMLFWDCNFEPGFPEYAWLLRPTLTILYPTVRWQLNLFFKFSRMPIFEHVIWSGAMVILIYGPKVQP